MPRLGPWLSAGLVVVFLLFASLGLAAAGLVLWLETTIAVATGVLAAALLLWLANH